MVNRKLIEINSIEIGVTSDENWYFRKGRLQYVHKKESNSALIFLLPLLEINYFEFKYLISEILKELNREALYGSFPEERLLITALSSNSEYWISLALNWLENIIDLKYFSLNISQISNDKKYSQKIRHQALKLLARTK